MKEDFIIRIKSRTEQFDHMQPVRTGEDDRIEIMTYGSLVKKGDTYYITYKETQTIGFEGCTTTIKIAADGSRVAMLRFGPANAQLIVERDRRNICYYETEVGGLTLGVGIDECGEPVGRQNGFGCVHRVGIRRCCVPTARSLRVRAAGRCRPGNRAACGARRRRPRP